MTPRHRSGLRSTRTGSLLRGKQRRGTTRYSRRVRTSRGSSRQCKHVREGIRRRLEYPQAHGHWHDEPRAADKQLWDVRAAGEPVDGPYDLRDSGCGRSTVRNLRRWCGGCCKMVEIDAIIRSNRQLNCVSVSLFSFGAGLPTSRFLGQTPPVSRSLGGELTAVLLHHIPDRLTKHSAVPSTAASSAGVDVEIPSLLPASCPGDASVGCPEEWRYGYVKQVDSVPAQRQGCAAHFRRIQPHEARATPFCPIRRDAGNGGHWIPHWRNGSLAQTHSGNYFLFSHTFTSVKGIDTVPQYGTYKRPQVRIRMLGIKNTGERLTPLFPGHTWPAVSFSTVY
ncbi:hypothetical protein QBC40DRAFT_344521 [Triangularia verruculosa]|uniref:Uncharacterized protein n=1 Tax=Triangularia verruculosa TaxID=2587418 RepID=A0AAN6XU22_9PEZI|nr:hypothetical protein QBC40DRAFT_344521 [Triangularia verruculosa]